MIPVNAKSACTAMPSLQVLERAAHVGSGLLNLGYESSQDTFVGICSINKDEVC